MFLSGDPGSGFLTRLVRVALAIDYGHGLFDITVLI